LQFHNLIAKSLPTFDKSVWLLLTRCIDHLMSLLTPIELINHITQVRGSLMRAFQNRIELMKQYQFEKRNFI